MIGSNSKSHRFRVKVGFTTRIGINNKQRGKRYFASSESLTDQKDIPFVIPEERAKWQDAHITPTATDKKQNA